MIKLHLDYYIQQILKDCKEYIKNFLRPKKVLILPGGLEIGVCTGNPGPAQTEVQQDG
jgi:hypothetical protein